MNWYKILKLAQLSGEYWIDSSGGAIFADGDVGDYNHEGYVMVSILGKYDLDYEGSGVDLQGNIAGFVNERWDDVLNYYVQTGELTAEQYQVAVSNPMAEIEPGYTYKEYMVDNFTGTEALLMAGATQEEADLAMGRGDARLYATKEWGWKRLAGRDVETWTATSKDLETIASGLYDAYGEECEGALFNIWVASANKWYKDVSYEIISSGNVMALRGKQFVGW